MSPRLGIVVDVAADEVRAPLPKGRVADVVRLVLRRERCAAAMISVAWVTRQEMTRLNRKHLGHRGETDIITFAMRDGGSAGTVVGDIYIAPDVARDNARRIGGSIREEMVRLVVHGTLHALGQVHPDGEERSASPMWARQESLVRVAMTHKPLARRSS